MRCILLISMLISCSGLFASVSAEETGVLSVEISAVNPRAGGTLQVALFRSNAGWPKFSNAWKIRILTELDQRVIVRFTDLPFAENYAVEVHHDENDNGKFDMRWFPYPRPKEGVGVSNNKFGIGPPDFADARFALDRPEKSIKILMHY